MEATHLRELCGLDRFAFDAALDALERHDVLTTSNGQYRYSVELMRRWVPLERWGSSGDVPPVA